MQLSLLGHERPGYDPSFSRLRHLELGRGAWLDHLPGWVRGHRTLFEALRDGTSWQQHRRWMYDREVDVPRLTAKLPDDGPGHPLLVGLTKALSRRYLHRMDRISLALYRHGQDSVAWHGDKIRHDTQQAVVAIVSLGEPRRFLLRPRGGGPSRAFECGWGDLLVMGGTCQRTFEHTVPKVAHADPRMAVMFRHASDGRGAPPG